MQNLHFPLRFSFKITTLANDFTATDSRGNIVAYVRQKMFKFKEDIQIFSDESRANVLYSIKADRWIDFSAAYAFIDERTRQEFGKIARKGWKSIWKAEYEIIDQHGKLQYHIREENAWVKVMDSFLGEIPILGFFTGYFFNPTYLLTDLSDRPIAKLSKEASFFGKEFTLEKTGPIDGDDDDRILLGFMMMVLLERQRG